jgi:F-type H+-transporting ATPase subunit delta
MTSSAIAKRYAEAFAEVVTAGGAGLAPQDASRELGAFTAAVESSVELYNVLTSPSVPSSRKKAAVARIGDALGLSRITRNFLFVLIDHHRIPALPEIFETFGLILDERLGFARAEVSSARDLDEAQRAAVNGTLERLTGKRIRMRFAVDESLIGGILARIGSTVYDGSVRGQLAALGRRLSTED